MLYEVITQFAGYLGELPNGLTTTHMLYVNKKLLTDNGLSMPTSYADMKAMVAPLKAKGIDLLAMDNMDAWVMQSCLFSMVRITSYNVCYTKLLRP